jgi:hypothetical protein
MWKNISEGIAGSLSLELNRPPLASWNWRKVLADLGLLLAFVATSSWLIRR